jgi:FkbM family methyltransferase
VKEAYRACFCRGYVRARDHLTRFYSSLVKPSDLCIDVGANYGTRTEAFLRLGARVITLEPNALCVEELNAMFGREPRVVVVAAAAGPAEGQMTMHVSDNSVISSLSEAWVEHCEVTPGLKGSHWIERMVPVTTLDRLIAEHGRPAFVKIDVEGFEIEVLKGLSQPVGALSYEYTADGAERALECLDYLLVLGAKRFNSSRAETMVWDYGTWTDAAQMAAHVREVTQSDAWYGDVYAKFD